MLWIGVGVGHKLEQMHDSIAVVVVRVVVVRVVVIQVVIVAVALGQPKLSLTKTKNWRRQRRTINFPAPVTVSLVVALVVVVFVVVSVRQVTHIFLGPLRDLTRVKQQQQEKQQVR